jgi:hypothetical protein
MLNTYTVQNQTIGIDQSSITNTSTFLSAIQENKPKQEIYVTFEDLQKNNVNSYKRFTTYFLVVTLVSNLILMVGTFSAGEKFVSQQTSCKLFFFSNFYINLLINIFLVFFQFLALQYFLENKNNPNFEMMMNRKIIFSIFITQLFFACVFFVGEKNCCSSNLESNMYYLLIVESFQFILQFMISFYFLARIRKDYELTIALDEESVKNKEKNEDKFNGSFALNLSLTAPSAKENFSYKRKKKMTPNKEINIQELDNLEIVKETCSKINRLNKKLIKFSTPTKDLTNKFKNIDVEN